MLARVSSLIVLALPLFVAASAVVPRDTPTVNQCKSGTIQCCQGITQSDSELAATISGTIGVALGPIPQLLGLQCTGIIGGTSCTDKPVCCNGHTYYGGVLVLDCSPIDINA